MDVIQRELLHLLVENVAHPAPVSCKGKTWSGKPLVWNDKANKCVGVSSTLHKALETAQKASASAIGHSQHARAYGEKHKDAEGEHSKATEHHKAAAEVARKEGFYHVSASLIRQAGHHERMTGLHREAGSKATSKPKEGGAEADGKDTTPKTDNGAVAGGASHKGHRDHMGRFRRRPTT